MDKRKSPQIFEHTEKDEHSNKRRKRTPENSPDTTESRVSVQELGLKIIDVLTHTTDRKGDSIVEAFRVLPGKREYPDYYKAIENPISLNNIQSKLRRYQAIDDLEADFDLLTSNAQVYNKASSSIYANSVKIKTIVTKILAENRTSQSPDKRSIRPRRASSATTLIDADLKNTLVNLIKDLLDVKDINGDRAADHFLELPPKRQFPDYYEMIKEPISITIIRRKLKKGEYTGANAVDEFEEEVMKLFSNAEQYNEEGSEILDDASRLKAFLIPRMEEIRDEFSLPPKRNPLLLKISNDNKTEVQNRVEDVISPKDSTIPDIQHTQREEQSPFDRNAHINIQDSQQSMLSGKAQTSKPSPTLPDIKSPKAQMVINSKLPVSSPEIRMPNRMSATPSLSGNGLLDSQNYAQASAHSVINITPDHAEEPASKGPIDTNVLVNGSSNETVPKHNQEIEPSHTRETRANQKGREPQAHAKARPPTRTSKNSPVVKVRFCSSPRNRPLERYDIDLFPSTDLYFSSSTFNLTYDNNHMVLMPYMNPAIYVEKARCNLFVTLNGHRVMPINNNTYHKDYAFQHFELSLNRGQVNRIDLFCEASIIGELETDKAHFEINAVVAGCQ